MFNHGHNNSASPSFLKREMIQGKDILVPSVIFAFVLQLVLMIVLHQIEDSHSPTLKILIDATSMALLTFIAIKLFVIPKVMRQQSHFVTDTANLVATIDKHCIFATVAADGTILHANQKFSDISGYQIEELIGQNHRILNSGHFSKQDWKLFYKTLSQGKVWQGNIRNRTKDGELYWVFTTVYPVFDNDKLSGYFTLRSDITDIVNRAEQSLEVVEELQKSEQRLTDFTNHIVHELRTPIHIITNFNHILFEQMRQQRNIDMLKQSQDVVDHMSGLVNELLDLAKIKEGKLTIHNEDVDLISMLKNIYSELELSVKDANVKVVLNIADNFPSTIICDKVRIKQAIYNLTSNALKFTQRGQITISAESLVSDVATHPSLIRISVSDTGIGIKPDDLSQVFSEFYQVKGKKSRRGTGLGLTISKKLIGLMGGDLTACSTFGEGSEFIITLPFTPAASQTSKTQPLSLENTIFDEHTLSDFRIVIVDDVPTNVLVAEAILRRYGAHVSSFIDPQEALAYVLNNPNTIDAIVTDYNMPEMTGLELAHRIHAAPGFEDLKIFALSGAIDKDLEALTGEGSPITACLSKPLEIRELVGVLLSYQHSPRTPREVGQAESV